MPQLRRGEGYALGQAELKREQRALGRGEIRPALASDVGVVVKQILDEQLYAQVVRLHATPQVEQPIGIDVAEVGFVDIALSGVVQPKKP